MIYNKTIPSDGLYHLIQVMLISVLSICKIIFKINGTVVSFHEVRNQNAFLSTELWFSDKYYPPANATISNFEIWGAAEISNVETKITTTQPTTTTTTTTNAPVFSLMEAIPSFQLPGIYNSTSPAWRDFIIMFEEIGPEFRWGLKHSRAKFLLSSFQSSESATE